MKKFFEKWYGDRCPPWTWSGRMSCPKCGCEHLSGPHQNLGLERTVWNGYRCKECGFRTYEPADDDPRERAILNQQDAPHD